MELFSEPGPRVFAAPAGVAFADALADGVGRRLDAIGAGPLALADVTLAVSTRRLGRAVRSAFARRAGGAALGPRLVALDRFGDEALGGRAGAGEPSPPAIGDMRRVLTLTGLVRGLLLAAPDLGPTASAPALARDLAKLLDDCAAAGASLDALAGLEAGRHAAHWEPSKQFLDLLAQAWPAILAEAGLSDREARRAEATARIERAWAEDPPTAPIILAGAPVDATAERLFAMVARAPQGAVVLPGLDLEIDAAAEAAIGSGAAPEHPQAALTALLRRIGVGPDAARAWTEETRAEAAPRRRLLSQALRPAPVTDAWADARDALAAEAGAATARLGLIEAASPREEATAIALALREAVETPGKTAALITPDRMLARRVSAELRRWDVKADDSSGRPLGLTPPGVFFMGCAQAALDGLAPTALLDVLKHPLASAGVARGVHLRLTRRLERDVLRGRRPPPGPEGLRGACAAFAAEAADDPRTAEAAEALQSWIDRVLAALQPLTALAAAGEAPLAQWVAAHRTVAEALSLRPADDAPSTEAAVDAVIEPIEGDAPASLDAEEAATASGLYDRAAGEELAAFLGELSETADALGPTTAAEYPALIGALLADRSVREPYGLHPRVTILGALEARMQSADLVVLAGLNEGVWPRLPEPDPWLSRDMRAALGLAPLEAAIGLSAHDFVLAASAPEAFLSRARKADGAPTTASRWLVRLETLLDAVAPKALVEMRARGGAWVDLARRLDDPAASPTARGLRPARRPRPSPPVEVRPMQFGATEIETLIRDPYSVYARKILRLRPLPPLDDRPDARDRGEALHAVAEGFVDATRGWDLAARADEAAALWDEIAVEQLRPIAGWPALHAFWIARARQTRDWFVGAEIERRALGRPVALETTGELKLDTDLGEAMLTAKADRIDWIDGAGYAIFDYKTGAPPSAKQQEFFAKQLPIEAAILGEAGFEGAPPDRVAKLAYLTLSGRLQGGYERPASVGDVETAAREAVAGVRTLLSAYASEKVGYPARSRPALLTYESAYDHLSRYGEWRDGDGA